MPKALKVAAVFVVLLAIVPGLPAAPFLVIAAALFFVARVHEAGRWQRTSSARPPSRVARRRTAGRPRIETSFVPMVVPWSIEVSEDLAGLLDEGVSEDGTERESLRGVALGLRSRLFAELGIPLPPPRVRAVNGLPARSAVVSLFEVPAAFVPVPEGLNDAQAVVAVTEVAAELLRARAADFLGLAETQRLLDELEQFAPATVRNVVPKPVSLTLLTDVLRRLVEERV